MSGDIFGQNSIFECEWLTYEENTIPYHIWPCFGEMGQMATELLRDDVIQTGSNVTQTTKVDLCPD